MSSTFLKALASVGSFSLVTIGQAGAGGLKRDGYHIDLLFDPARFAAEVTATYVMPDRKLNNVKDTNPSDGIGADGRGGGTAQGVRDTADYWIPRLGLKAGFGEAVDCLLDYSQPWGAHTNPGRDWMGANDNIETKVNSNNFAATCSYKFQAGQGQLRLLGGFSYQELNGFQERLIAAVPPRFGSGVGRVDLGGDGTGWRVGTAYEIPEIALRASLVYNSEVALDDITGTLDLTQVPAGGNSGNPLLGKSTPIFGSAAMPQTLKLSLQSGIAPDWLAFGSIEWVEWSKLKSIAFCPQATRRIACTPGGPTEATSFDLLYRDGWTIEGGVGHKFSDQWSGGASITWDRGTSQGMGHQSDVWTLGFGASYTPRAHVELRFAGVLGVMTSGSSSQVVWDGRLYGENVSYTFGNDFISALSANLKVRW